jgi:actin-related protein 6
MCYISTDLAADMRLAAQRPTPLLREFVMPDYIHVTRGFVKPVDGDRQAAGAREGAGEGEAGAVEGGARAPAAKKAKARDGAAEPKGGGRNDEPEEQLLGLSVERFATGEVLFHPVDIGIEEAGLPEAIVQAVGATLPDLHEALYSNILVTGGTSRLPNFAVRLEAELRQLVPADYALNIRPATDPIVAAWRGASHFAAGPLFERSAVSRAEYLEHGHSFVRRACHN